MICFAQSMLASHQDGRSLLETWLAPASVDEFREHHLQRAPVARPGSAIGTTPLLDWQRIERVLAAGADTLVVAKGALVDEPVPRTLQQLGDLMSRGIGLCVRHAEQHDEGLARVAAAFEPIGPAHVQLFVTPGGSYGFGWHYDDEDVFIVQTAGRKEYYFRRNTVAADEVAHPVMFARYQRETSALCAASLVTGDFLYVPARWWHMAVCAADALSISVGVRPREPRDHGPRSSSPT